VRTTPTPDVDDAEDLLPSEGSESALRKDRTIKAPLFARYGLREYWTVNVMKREVEVNVKPLDGDYSDTQTFAAHEPIVSAALPGLPVTPADFTLE